MSQIKVSAKRHLAKTISYRIISTLIGFLIMWGLTGKIEFGAAFGVIELLYKPIQYYIHERIWYRWISYGLNRVNTVKQKNPIVIKKRYNPKPPQSEPIIVDEIEQPITPQIKRLTYTKNSDN